ncbi:RUN domain-containing protein, partial [Haematococcus lacustris]
GSRAVLHLSDMWQDLPVQPGDSLNVIRPRDQGCEQGVRQLVCSASEGLCVLHPDILLSGTTVTSAMDCTRKAWLSELFGGGANNDKAVLGTLSHELVQWALRAAVQGPMRLPSRAQCVTQAHEIVAASASKLFEVGVSADVAVKALTDKVTALLAWLAKYVGAGHAGPRDLVMGPNHQGPATQVLVEEVVDIEESIWAPQYGLKGQLDATLRALEGGDEASSGMRPQQWSGLTSHLGPSHGQFLRHWLGLVELEDSAAREGRSALWAVPGRQRALQGSCLADLQLQDTLVLAAKKEIRMMEPYLRQPQSEGLPPLPTQQGTAQPPCAANRGVLPSAAAVLWRLDKDEAAAGVTQQRTNLLMLMEAASGQVARLRDLVVDLAPPRMVAEQAARCEASSDLALACSHLNSEQQAAVQAVLQMQDYTLILGMPGTGKTSTTVCAIQAMVAAGRSVLLTAYTNSAVDNICLKLAAAAVQFVRLPGSSLDAVHPGVRGHTPGGERYPAGNSAEGLTQLAADVKVVAVTCLGVRHPLLARRSFDVCVLDEASQ